jgi:hypothetical protein
LTGYDYGFSIGILWSNHAINIPRSGDNKPPSTTKYGYTISLEAKLSAFIHLGHAVVADQISSQVVAHISQTGPLPAS